MLILDWCSNHLSIIMFLFVANSRNVKFIVLLCCLLASSFLLCSSAAIDVPHHQYVLVIANNNISNYSLMIDDPDGSDHRHLLMMPIWAYRIASGYLFFISVVGLILNVIVIIVILNDPKKMTPLNWMLFNLAWSDGIIAGFGAPISAIAAFYSGWPFSQEFCSAYALITSTAGIGSITTLSALAIYRCKLVVQKHVHPPNRISAFTNHSVRLGRRQASLLLALIWSYALIVTCPPLFGWGHYDREAGHISCSVDWQLKFDNNRSYVFYVFAMGLFVPTVVIVVSYSNILRVVRRVKREIRQRTSVLVKSTQKNRRSDAAEKRSTIMVAVMIGAFVVTWLPYSILALIEFFKEIDGDQTIPSSVWWSTLPCLLAKTAVVLNPIIYGFLNTQFRLAWENFSIKFLGRSGRFYNQGMIGGTSSNDHSQPRQLLADFSPAAAIPLAKILPRSLLSSQHQKSSLKPNVDCNPPSAQQQEEEKQETISNFHLSPSAHNNPPSVVLKENLNGNDEQQQNELPVSLEIVRYLPSNGDIHRISLLHVSSTAADV